MPTGYQHIKEYETEILSLKEQENWTIQAFLWIWRGIFIVINLNSIISVSS